MMKKIIVFFALIFFAGLYAHAGNKYDIVVAKDGSGDFKSVQEAIHSVKDNNPKRTTIFIKNGIYQEHVEVPETKMNLSLIGENAEKTIIIDSLCVLSVDPETHRKLSRTETTTFVIYASDFYAENLTFENNSTVKAQALAISIEGERAKFLNCRLVGFQDTMYASGICYLKNCYVSGTTDFIYGSATMVFQNCEIHSRRGNYITASSAPKDNPFGIVFLNCKLSAEPEVVTFLGRPWREYANVVYINCEMDAHIRPEGWNNWGKPEREATATYAEYHSKGPGANRDARVKWSKQLTDQESEKYTVENILSNTNHWDYRAL